MSLSLILLKTDYRKLLAIDLIMTGQNQYDLEMTFALICKANCLYTVYIFDFAFMYNYYYTAL